MHRIDTNTKAVDLFGAGKHGYKNGDQALGVPATDLDAAVFNAVQEEIVGVIEAAGIALVKGDHTQLTSAIRRMITGGDLKDSVRVASTANIAALTGLLTIDGVVLAAGDRVLVKDQGTGADNGIYVAAADAWARATDADTGAELSAGATIPVEAGTANADTLWMLTNDGAVTIGATALVFQIKSGDASTARKGMVQLATSAEAQALTDALKALTPATLAAAMQGANQSLGVSGYQKLPGGLILQWGRTPALTAGTPYSFSFPIAFPTAVYATVATGADGSGTTTMAMNMTNIGGTVTGRIVSNISIAEASWFALGK